MVIVAKYVAVVSFSRSFMTELPPFQRKERANRHLKGGERTRLTTQKAKKTEGDTSTQHEQQHSTTNNIQQHNTTTTQPPTHHHSSTRRTVRTIPHHCPCLPSCLLIFVCCLVLLVSVSVLSILPRFCPDARLSVCLDVRLVVGMSLSVRIFVCLSLEKGKGRSILSLRH